MTRPSTPPTSSMSGPAKNAGRRRIAGDRLRRPTGPSGRAGGDRREGDDNDDTDDTAGTPVIDLTDAATKASTATNATAATTALADPADPAEVLSDTDPVHRGHPDPDAETDAEGPAAAAADPADTAARPASARLRPRTITAVLTVCLVAVLAACALVGLNTRRDRADATAGNGALAAARTSAVKILSYDYRHLDADFAQATALTTGSFRTQYQATTAKAVKDLALRTKAVVTASVAAGGVVSSSADEVTVLLFVNQSTTSNRLDSAKVDLNRVQLTMTRTDGHWLVSALSAL